MSTNQKIGGSIPGASSPHVKVALGKLLNDFRLDPYEQVVAPCMEASAVSVSTVQVHLLIVNISHKLPFKLKVTILLLSFSLHSLASSMGNWPSGRDTEHEIEVTARNV